MLRFQRNSGFKLLSPRRFQPRGRFANFHVCLFVKLAAGPFWQSSACFSLFTTFQLPKWPGIDFPTFPWSFPARSGYLWTKIDRNRRFGCNLTRFSLIAYTSLSNPSLPFSRQTNDIFCKFFLNFQGLIQPPLLSWQKAGRIWLGFAGNHSNSQISPLSACISFKSFPFPVFERYDTNSIFSILSSLFWCVVTLFFIQAFQNATFGVKNTALAQKSVELQQFDDISIIAVQINLHQT